MNVSDRTPVTMKPLLRFSLVILSTLLLTNAPSGTGQQSQPPPPNRTAASNEDEQSAGETPCKKSDSESRGEH